MQKCNADYICLERTLHFEQKQRSLRGKQKVSAFHKALSATPCNHLAESAGSEKGSVVYSIILCFQYASGQYHTNGQEAGMRREAPSLEA